MDVNDFRAWVTAISLLLFLGLVALTWSRSRRAAYDEAALLPFAGDENAQETRGEQS
jgi:cytochrome c oxidase cbb3-type subunit IV